MRRDLAVSEPPFVCRISRRDEAAAALEKLGAAADCVRAVDQIEDRVDAVRVSRMYRVHRHDAGRHVTVAVRLAAPEH